MAKLNSQLDPSIGILGTGTVQSEVWGWQMAVHLQKPKTNRVVEGGVSSEIRTFPSSTNEAQWQSGLMR